jgi:hypothetical protein
MTVEELKDYLNKITNTQKEVVINDKTITEENLKDLKDTLNIEI